MILSYIPDYPAPTCKSFSFLIRISCGIIATHPKYFRHFQKLGTIIALAKSVPFDEYVAVQYILIKNHSYLEINP